MKFVLKMKKKSPLKTNGVISPKTRKRKAEKRKKSGNPAENYKIV